MEDQIGTVLHWNNQKEPKQAKSKDEVIRMNLDRIHISAATPLPSNPSRHSQVSPIKNNNNNKQVKSFNTASVVKQMSTLMLIYPIMQTYANKSHQKEDIYPSSCL